MKLQASISGYGRPAATVYGLFDESSGNLIINKSREFRADRFADCLVISNQDLPGRDFKFDEEMLQEAITCFFDLLNSGRITVEEAAQKCNPTNRIEQDEITSSGRSYRMQGVDDAQVAVLAMCHYVKRAKAIRDALTMQDALLGLQKGSILTI